MPEVNLLRDTQSPEDPASKPPRPQPDFEVSDPAADRGMGKFFKSFLGRGPKTPTPDPSRMGMGKSGGDQRILRETRSAGPAIAPLPEDEDKNLDVNLLSEDMLNRQKPREQLIKLGLTALGAMVFVGLVYAGLVIMQKSVSTQISESRDQLASVQQQIKSLQSQQATIQQTAQKIAAIRGLIDRHIRWTKLFGLIEKYTLPSVSYGTLFAGNLGGNFTLSAGTGSYEDMAKQYLVYQQAVERKEFLKSFSITGASKTVSTTGQPRVNFSVTLDVLPSAFENTTPTANDQLSIIPNISRLAVYATYLAGLCYLQQQPADLGYVPAAVRADFQAVASKIPASTCAGFSADDRDRARRLLSTDTDQDGLNALLEALMETNDEQADSNANGSSDLTEFLALVNQPPQP